MDSQGLGDYFALFNLSRRFELDVSALEQRHRVLQAEVHPDRFAHLSDAEKRVAMQWAAHINEAYRTLKQPLARARYLLQQSGVTLGEHDNTVMPTEFLMQQMIWREALEEAQQARSLSSLDVLQNELREQINDLRAEFTQLWDRDHALDEASQCIRRWMFVDKILITLEQVRDELDA